jgi:hypothetical protein
MVIREESGSADLFVLHVAAILLVLGALPGCGGGGGSVGGGGGGGSGAFAATVDGQGWSGDTGVSATASASTPGTYILVGSRLLSGSTYRTLNLTLYNIAATGTYPLGVGPTVVGGIGTVTDGATTWLTPLSGAAGTVTISTLSSSTIAGTFSFTATPLGGGAGSRVVGNGSFAIPVTGTAGTVPAGAGSRMSAVLGGVAWNAATVVTVSHSGGVYAFGGSNTDSFVNFTLSSITGPGTVALNTTTETLSVQQGLQEWSSIIGGSGSVTITELTASRIKGTVSATLQAGGGGTLSISGGTFDVGLQ